MRNPFRKKPPPADIVVLEEWPCPTCRSIEYHLMPPIHGREVVECVGCHTQWFRDVLFKNGYTSGKGQG